MGSKKRTAKLPVVRAVTAQPHNILQLVPALQEEAETDMGNAGSNQLPGPAQLGNQFDSVSNSSQLAPGASLSTMAWIPTWGHKIKTTVPREFLNFSSATE